MKRIVTVICAYALTLAALHAQQSKPKVLNTLSVDSMIEQAVGMAPLAEKNFKSLKYFGIFTCAKKNEYTVYTSVMQSAEGIVLSSVTTVNNHDSKKQILFWNVDLANAFSRRTDALFTWYKNQLSLEK